MRRRWIVDDENEYGELSREAVQAAFLDAEALLSQIGGSLIVQVARTPMGNEIFRNDAIIFQYESFAPAQKPQDEPVGLPADPDRDVEIAA